MFHPGAEFNLLAASKGVDFTLSVTTESHGVLRVNLVSFPGSSQQLG